MTSRSRGVVVAMSGHDDHRQRTFIGGQMLLQLESAHLWDAYIDQQDALPIGTIGAQETLGIGTEMALNGAAAHAFTHIIYKALLLMSAGAVLMATGRRKCSELGGLFHSMPLTTICGTIGALAISSFPLTPEHEWPLALSRARGLPLDGVEMIGIVASVVLVTWMLRDLMPASDLAAATMLNVMRFFLAIPLLALFVGPFMLRRTRRGLETLRQQRESTRETKTSLKQISHE